MRKFWKLGLIVGIVAFMAGCSNLWDYVPPPRVDNAPVSSDGASGGGGGGGGGKPSGGGGGSGPTRKVLTFYVDDGSGTLKEVKVQANNKTASATDIMAAYTGNPTAPNGFVFETDGSGFKWYKSDTVTPIGAGDFSPGEKFVLGLTPATGGTTNGYTIMTAPTSSRDTGRDLVTTPTSEGSKTLKDVLVVAGVADSSDVDAKPKTTPSGWEFVHWANPKIPNTPFSPSNQFNSGDKITAVYNVDYTINIGGYPYTVKVPVAAPNDGATWADILAAAKGSSSPVSGADKLKIDGLLWKDSAGKVVDSTKRYPANTTFTSENAISFNVGGTIVKVADPDGNNQATWAEIKAAAIAQGVEIDKPTVTGMTGKFKEWQTNGGAKADDNTLYSPTTTTFSPAFEVNFSINGGGNNNTNSYTKTVTAASDSNLTLKQIFENIFSDNGSAIKTTITQKNPSITNPTVDDFIEGKSTATSATQGFDGWVVRTPDGTEVIVKSSEIRNQSGDADVSKKYPSGTTITPHWIPQLLLSRGDGTATDLGIDFTWFEGGFIDGSTKIGDFYISNTEITIDQWKKVMSTNGEGANWIQMDGATQWNNKKGTTGDSPMDRISWYDAIMFCNQLSKIYERTLYYELEVKNKITNGSKIVEAGTYTGDDFFAKLNDTGVLHSKDQFSLWGDVVINITKDTSKPGFRIPDSNYWRYAAHGGKDNIYPEYSGTTGNTEADLAYVAWYGNDAGNVGNSGGRPHPVGTRGGDNPVRDMTGNVSEWCWDEYHNNTRLYIGGTYDAGSFNGGTSSYLIDAVKTPNANGIFGAMFGNGNTGASELNKKYHAGQAGDRNTQGMRIIIPGKPGDYNF